MNMLPEQENIRTKINSGVCEWTIFERTILKKVTSQMPKNRLEERNG